MTAHIQHLQHKLQSFYNLIQQQKAEKAKDYAKIRKEYKIVLDELDAEVQKLPFPWID
jgi:hypothetical protein